MSLSHKYLVLLLSYGVLILIQARLSGQYAWDEQFVQAANGVAIALISACIAFAMQKPEQKPDKPFWQMLAGLMLAFFGINLILNWITFPDASTDTKIMRFMFGGSILAFGTALYRLSLWNATQKPR